MDDEEESSGVFRPLPVLEQLNEEEKLSEVELPNTRQFEVLNEMDDSQLGGSLVIQDVKDSEIVGDDSIDVAEMVDVQTVENPPLVVADMDDSELVENPPLVVADMDDSELVENPPVVDDLDHSKLVENPPLVVEDMDDSKLVENPPLVVEDMKDSEVDGNTPVVAGMDDSQVVETPTVASDMDDSQLAENPQAVADMGHSPIVENPPVMTDIDDSKLVGESVEMKDVEIVGGAGDAVNVDDSRLVGGSPLIPDMDDTELLGGSPVVQDMDDLELAGGSHVVDKNQILAEEGPPLEEVVDMEEDNVAEGSGRGGRKRRRGRAAKAPTKSITRKKIEEDVCFICFDGGNLVLCDRRGCPKAYHPACVNRDEAFFRSKGRWNCGWHICSNCEKAAQYMCYTCTYSLCKSCIKEAEFLCVRGNKGFCQTCMKTVMLVEKNEQAQVDFDDKNSWEFLFKDYWLDLKGKLSLTLDELTQARNPSRGSGVSARKEESSDEIYNVNNDQESNSDSGSEHLEVTSSKKRKSKRKSKISAKEEVSSSATLAAGSDGISTVGDTEWASKELLEFVAHMKNGDTSILSQFDVQALLLDYIKQNDLRDPRRKSQIICDTRLRNLFSKARVGHFEMLKLLESHFLLKEDAQADDQEGNVDTDVSQLDAEGNSEASTKAGTDKRRKKSKKSERGLQTNVDDYAAIDVHNINLVYLKRNLVEDLLKDMDTFHDKVVGSFVRIRITGAGHKQDMYRLVQVIGTGKGETYEAGKMKTDVKLEILNLNKTEEETIDRISSQDFSEDECKRLRQSIKCGLISRLTVGDIQEKAMALQAARVNDWLEAEKLRLSHLRDRASEKGRRKELRECVEKLQLLNTPEERSRRLQEIPEVHTDPNMDPSYESEEEEAEADDRRDKYMRPRDAGYSRKGREHISPGKGSSNSSDIFSGSRKGLSTSREPSRNTSTLSSWDKRGSIEVINESSWSQGRDAQISRNQAAASDFESDTWSDQAVIRSEPSSQITPTSLSTGVTTSSSVAEAEKVWHYKDPSGKIQGPFSMVQLRKWSTTGYFPADLKIWRATEKPEDSLSLTDALNGRFEKELPQWDNNFSAPQKVGSGSDNARMSNTSSGWDGNSPLQIVKPAETLYHGERTDFQNPPTPTPGSGSWTNVSWSGQSPTPVVNGMQQSVNGSTKESVEWSGHSPTPVVGERNLDSLSASISQPDSAKPTDGGADPPAPNKRAMEMQGFVPAPAKPSMSTWNSSGNGYNNKPPEENHGWRSADSAHQIPNMIIDQRHGGVQSQEWVAPPVQIQDLPAPSPNMAAAQVANYPNPGFSVSSSVQPFTTWSPTPNTQSGNPWGAGPNKQQQPSPVPPKPNMQPLAHVAVGTNMQLPPMQAAPHIQPPPLHMQPPFAANQGWRPPPVNANMGWGGSVSVQGNMNMAGWSAPQPRPQLQPQGNNTGIMQQWGGNTNTGWGPPVPNNMSRSQQKHDGNRYSGHRDQGGYHGGGGGDSNLGGDRQSWNRQSSFRGGQGGGGGSSGPSQKGPRMCKYYESGTCRRGANCEYLHP